jgi:hypothetical protein
MNKYILAKEKTIQNIIFREFNKSKKELVLLLKKQETKSFLDFIKIFIDDTIKKTVLFVPYLKNIINKGATETKIKEQNFSIDWDLRNDPAVRYLQELTELHLSQNK